MIHLQGLSFERAGSLLFRNLTISFGSRKYGLVGHNGVGKSTLARVIAGEWAPTSGRVTCEATVGFLPQFEPSEGGYVYETFAELWSTPVPEHAAIHRWAGSLDPDRRLDNLSGGEWMKLRLARALSQPRQFLILDEPTNDLDREGRELLIGVVRRFTGGLLVISHDCELLHCMDEILELTPKRLERYRGSFDEFREHRERERTRQADALRTARREKRKTEAIEREKIARQQKRARSAARAASKGGLPKIVAGGLKRKAQVTDGRLQSMGRRAINEAATKADSAFAALDSDPFLRLDFESSAPPFGRILFEAKELNFRHSGSEADLWHADLDFEMRGGECWHLRGRNGSGKSTLMRLLMGKLEGAVRGHLRRPDRTMVYLDQKQSLLSSERSILENILEESRFDPVQLRNELAFHGFTGHQVHQVVGSLSGGQRLRAALARMFLGPAVPEIVLLDEPTNNLDFQSMELLEKALSAFRGLLVVVTHDEAFVDDLGITNELEL